MPPAFHRLADANLAAVPIIALAGLLIATLTGQLSVALLAVLGFLGAAGTVGFSVASPALMPELVPRALLGAANGRLELVRTLQRLPPKA